MGNLLISILFTFSFQAFALEGIELGKHLSKREYGDLDVLVSRRYFKVLTNKNSLNYFLHKGKPRGLQYEMLKIFQNELNKKFDLEHGKLKIQFEVIPVSKKELIPKLLAGEGDIIASGLVPEFNKVPGVSFSDPYKKVHEVLVMRKGVDYESLELSEIISPGKTESDGEYSLSPKYFDIVPFLGRKNLTEHLIPLKVNSHTDEESEELIMEMVSRGKYKAAFIRSDFAELGLRAFPNLEIVDDHDPRDLGISWAVRSQDKALLAAINELVPKIKQGSLLGNLLSYKYFKELNLIKKEGFVLGRHKISKYDKYIKHYSEMYGLDWRLMAALCYQESRFRQDIKNEWGAIGLFQVKQMTANEPYINIPDIEGPDNFENNIHAGIKYLHWIKNRYFDEYEGMSEKNKVRMAIASYNAGPARIRKAIALAKEMGLDHTDWFRSVELALLKMRRTEPVQYVSEINKRYVAYQLLGIDPE